jgi:hypothetical protein
MIKEGRLVKERGLNSNYYEVVSVERDILTLDLNEKKYYSSIDNYEEVTNGRVDWAKVPKGTTIYYFSDMDYSWVKYEFLEYHKSNIKPSMDFITIKEEKYGVLALTCKDAYIMDDWLENEIRMYQEDVDPKTSDKGTEELENCENKKYNERDMLKDAYNFLERFLENHKADNQYFNQLNILYNFAKIGLKSIDKMKEFL